jgi:hypothetical protein
MIKIRASCGVNGTCFSPEKFQLLNSVKLTDAHGPGAIGTAGIYRGKPIPYGSATIQVSTKAEEDWIYLDRLLTVLEGCIDDLRKSGAEEIFLSCSLFHDGQCNFSFSREQLSRLAMLDVDLLISCYTEDLE